MAFLDPVLSPVFQPLINANPFLGILILALIISVLITIVYKYMTNQDEMKRLKDQQKEYQGKMKELKDRPDEMMKVQKEAMKLNMEYMKHSFKPTLITMLPIILIFGWMNAHLVYEPIYPGETFSLTAEFLESVKEAELIAEQGVELINSEAAQTVENNQAAWKLKSSAGTHFLTVKTGDEEQKKKVIITKELIYESPVSIFDHSDIKKITVNYNKLKPLGPDFTVPLFNWQPGWLGIYIMFSIVFSMGLRKALKLY